MTEGATVVFAIAVVLFFFWLCILLPISMARTRGRSALGWVFISLVFSPLFAIVMLMVLGDARR
ncbi:hypothetical protein NX862_17930 [Rhodobacter sp. KR11]|uniref:hypothetical protein n=1 Tax=Rhodobacter sp. KR11 TaxID=2974588 RepID=UPI0022227796|nr:hypothetical protein [Rhodobacter sp. KR11]MCW1920639.1 hypothetical protein [Rhodobacter sp. KR11]